MLLMVYIDVHPTYSGPMESFQVAPFCLIYGQDETTKTPFSWAGHLWAAWTFQGGSQWIGDSADPGISVFMPIMKPL